MFPDELEGELALPVVDQAIERVASARILLPEDYYAVSAANRGNAFTVSGDLTVGTIDQLRGILAADLRGGTDRKQFEQAVREAIPSLPISQAHLEQVYRNAVNAGFTEGGNYVLASPLVAVEFPYRLYSPIRDDRARKEHLALGKLGLNGTGVYHYADPTWRRFQPPWSWNCRCGWTPLTIEQAAARGVVEAQEWLRTGVEPRHVFVTPPEFAPDPRWDRSPLAAGV